MTGAHRTGPGNNRRNSWGIYHLRDDGGRSLCGKPQDLRHQSVGLREDPEAAHPCPKCLVAAVATED